MIEPPATLSKSRTFTIEDGSLVLTEQSTAAARVDWLCGQVVDEKYQILGLLGEGGMGTVYKARHLMLDREVALKTLLSFHLATGSMVRFQREAQAIAKINHKNVVQVFDFGLSYNGVPYYTMEYLLGRSLADRIRSDGPMEISQAIALFVQICHGLSAAHSKGIVHRDLKPSNVLLEPGMNGKGRSDTVKLVDFGIASLTDLIAASQNVTAHGVILGSPLYMSPEQSMGQTVSAHTDIYSLGCTLFQALTGRPPFLGASPLDTVMMHQVAEIPTLKQASGGKEYPPFLEQVVATMLAKSPENRYQTADQVAKALSLSDVDRLVIDRVKVRESRSNGNNAGNDSLPPSQEDGNAHAQSRVKSLLSLFTALVCTVILSCWFMTISKTTKGTPSASAKAQNSRRANESAGAGRPADSPQGDSNKIHVPRKAKVGADGRQYTVFSFPLGIDFGTFTESLFSDRGVLATGEVTWLTDRPPCFWPNERFLQNPANLDVFQAQDISGLQLRECPTSQKNSKLIQHIGRLTGLRSLNLDKSKLDDTDLPVLYKLSKLNCLSLNQAGISAGALAKLPQLRNLISLSCSDCDDATDILASLRGSSRMVALYLDSSNLTKADFETIGTLGNLSLLQVNNSSLQDSDLATLTSLTKLTTLSARGCKLTGAALKPLEIMKRHGLINLQLSSSSVAPADLKKIKELIPLTRESNDSFNSKAGMQAMDLQQMIHRYP
jgi:serine/threonine protein kinase